MESKPQNDKAPVLEGFEECPICYENMRIAGEIACGHKICTICLPKITKCAICRAPIRGPRGAPLPVRVPFVRPTVSSYTDEMY